MSHGGRKQTLVESYISGITDQAGERYKTILCYVLPELVTAFLLTSVLSCIDAALVSHLKSTALYATSGATRGLIHFLHKLAEGFSIGAVILCGQFNGLKRYTDAGRAAMAAIWLTLVAGGIIALALFLGAYEIYGFFRVTPRMIALGVPFLRLRAIGVFLAFIYFAGIGFLRGIKNTRVPMLAYLIGGVVFVFFDYALIFGKFGFPALGLRGSAIASILQYLTMIVCIGVYFVYDCSVRKYGLSLLRGFERSTVIELIKLGWPAMVDKAVLAASKLWLLKLIAPMGTMAIASFTVICDMEQFAFVPAIACAQVITFLVSNDYGTGNWSGIKSNIKKVLFLSSLAVMSVLLIFSVFSERVIHIFDAPNAFTAFAATAFPIISVLVLFDLLQVILAGALRGAANVRVVMVTRLIICACIFAPVSYWLSLLPVENPLLRFLLIYSTFYLADGLMGAVYIFWFRHDRWKQRTVSPQPQPVVESK